jgi:anti-sigma B factor antagonist
MEEQLADRFRLLREPMRPELSQTAPADRLSVCLLNQSGSDREVAILSVQGDVDLVTALLLQDALEPVLERQTGPVVVDLSEVAFMDSAGVHVLVDALWRLRLENRRLAVACREGGQIHRLLRVVGLLDALVVHRSRESAVTGGNDLLGPARRKACRPSEARRLTQRPPSTSPTTSHAAQAS